MASNGLITNPKKTVFLMLNDKENIDQDETTVKVGPNIIERTSSSKLLGMQIEDNQDLNIHFKNLVTSLS